MFRVINMNLIIYIYIFVSHTQVITAFFNDTLTVVEGRNLILPCKIPRKLDENLPLHNCIWTRSRTKTEYTGTTLLNTLHNSKYISAGNLEGGDCSLNITKVHLEEDEGYWVCALVVDNKSTVLSTIIITVLVPPLDHNLYNANDFLIVPNTTVYLNSNFGSSLNLKCVSQMAYPPTTLTWKLNREEITQKSEETFPDIRPSTFMTVSYLQITHLPSISYPIQISCTAFHPSYSSEKLIFVNFTVAHYAPSSARIQSGCELKNSEENDIFKMEENQILPLLCNANGIPLPSIQWEMKDDNNEWQPIFKHSSQFAIFVQSPGVYRCFARNKLSGEKGKAISPPVLVELEHSQTVHNDNDVGTGTAQLESGTSRVKGFLIEPRDTTVVVETPFKLNCILHGPVYNCTWTRNGQIWSGQNDGRVEILNDFENGDCIIHFKSALQEVDEGNWVCQAEFTPKEITKSRQAKVAIVHPPTSLILTYEGQKRVNGERILLNIDEHIRSNSTVAPLRCAANLENKNEKITWWINNRPETFPLTQITFLSINMYEISSSISLSVNKLPKRTKRSEIFIKCTINNHGPEIALKVQYPTRKVTLFPSGSVYVRKNSNLRLYCKANGKPSPEVSLQRQLDRDWQWLNAIPNRRWFTIRRTGLYRCVAKNKLNLNYLISKSTLILPTS